MTALALVLSGGPALAEGIVCDAAFVCSDDRCFAAPGFDAEAADYVEDAMGDAPRIYVSEGTWATAERRESQGTLSWLAQTAAGESVMLTVERTSGAYTMLRRATGATGRVWFATGTCENRS